MFTPSLGLFDTLYHGRLASLHVNNDERIFDESSDGLSITFFEAWEPFKIKDISEFPEMPMWVVLSVMLSLCILHVLASTYIFQATLKEKFNARHLMQGFHSYIAPPLQLDWELLYRKDEQNECVLTCWRRCG